MKQSRALVRTFPAAARAPRPRLAWSPIRAARRFLPPDPIQPFIHSSIHPFMTTTPSGLKYEVLNRGTGTNSPKPTDNVRVHYHGTLLNGKVFDSSVQRREPISFPLNRVIPGWTEGLQLMKVGDKFKFEIPPDLAYGDFSPSPDIPPRSTLVFEVELLGIE
jgi:FKBP-type peptidyl-prolyl cis-trans isomerase